MTHAELVQRAARWLLNTRKCGVVITEMGSGSPEHPDAIGWKDKHSTLIECKTSRSDFFADKTKWFRTSSGQAMGVMRLYMTPADLIQPEELPKGWGLLWVKKNRVSVERHGDVCALSPSDRAYEIQLLTSALRRLAVTPGVQGINCRTHVISAENPAARAEIFAQPVLEDAKP